MKWLGPHIIEQLEETFKSKIKYLIRYLLGLGIKENKLVQARVEASRRLRKVQEEIVDELTVEVGRNKVRELHKQSLNK